MATDSYVKPGKGSSRSDQGSQYSSDDWLPFCQANILAPNMDRRHNCWDEFGSKSFFRSLQKERIRKGIYKNGDVVRADIFEYLEAFFNWARR